MFTQYKKFSWLSIGASMLLLSACAESEDDDGGEMIGGSTTGTATGTGTDTGMLPVPTTTDAGMSGDTTTGDDTGGDTDDGVDPDDGGSDDAPDGGREFCEVEAEWFDGFMTDSCASCHTDGGAGAGSGFIDTSLEAMVANGQVVPGIASDSPIYTLTENNQMPPGNPLDPEQVERIGEFIDVCVEPEGEIVDCEPAPFLTFEDQIDIMQDDVNDNDFDADDDIRYVSLADISNKGICGSQLLYYKQAVDKLLNSLSDNGTATPTEAVDADGIILRLDLGDYGWDENIVVDGIDQGIDRWDFVNQSNAFFYAIPLVSENDGGDFQLGDDLGTVTPFMLSAQFVEFASNSATGVYYELAEMPDNFEGLFGDFFLSVGNDPNDALALQTVQAYLEAAGNGEEDRLDRYYMGPGEGRSAIANFKDRIIEFYELDDGRVVASATDFANANNAAQNPVELNADAELGAQSYEVFIQLENGMYAGAIYDGAFVRQDLTDSTIINDPFNTVNGGDAVASASCFGCHSDAAWKGNFGDVIFSDYETVIDDNDVENLFQDASGNGAARIDELYPDPSTFADRKDLLEADYQRALESRLGIQSFPPPGPIMNAYIQFNRVVDIETAAAEVGASVAEVRSAVSNIEDLEDLGDIPVARGVWGQQYANVLVELYDGDIDPTLVD